MVKKGKVVSHNMMLMKKKTQLLISLPLLMVASFSWAERSGFYTIMGPDGRIIVIDRRAAESSAPSKKQSSQAAPTTSESSQPTTQSLPPNKVVTLATPAVVQPTTSSVSKVADNQTVEKVPSSHKNIEVAPKVSVVTTKPKEVPLPTPKVSKVVSSIPAKQLKAVATSQSLPSVSSSKGLSKPVEVTPAVVEAVQPQRNSPIVTIDGEQYVESEYLEQKEFNLEGKKRFYSLPDGLGGTQVVQREKGLDMSVFRGPKIQAPKVVTLSKNYQRVPAETIISLTGTQCFSEKQIEKTKPLKENLTTDFWPKPSFEPKFDFVIAKFEQKLTDIEFTSYAKSIKNPQFYWPLPIFLDAKGCVMEGVNAFYLRTLPSNISQHQAIQGYLHVPDGAQYLLLTPLEAAADLDQIQLTNQGQVRLTPIR